MPLPRRTRRAARPRALVLALALVLLAGCTANTLMQRMVPAGTDTRARAYLALLQRGHVDSAVTRLTPQLRSSTGDSVFHQLAALLARRSLDSAQLIGVQVNNMPSERHVNLSWQFHDSLGYFVANVATVDRGGDWQVEGTTATLLSAPLETTNRFTLAGRGPRHYAWLLLTVLAFATSVAVAVRVARERGMPRRWLWAIVALLGLGQFVLNWTTGEWRVNPLYFMLFSSAMMKPGPVAPWILSFAIPVGAIVAEWRRRRWRADRDAARAAGDAVGAPPAPEPQAA